MSHTDLAPTRRGLVAKAGLLATLAAAGTVATAQAVDASGISPIERAFAEYERLLRRTQAAAGIFWDAKARFEEPARPTWHPARDEGGYRIGQFDDGRQQAFLDDREANVARLQAIIVEPFVFDPSFVVTADSHAQGVARARVTLSKIEAWQAEYRRRSDASGLTEATAVYDAASAAEDAQASVVRAMVPTNFRDLALQAAILHQDWDAEACSKLTHRLMRLAGVDPWDELEDEEAA